MNSLATVTDDEKKRYVIISYMFECGKLMKFEIDFNYVHLL